MLIAELVVLELLWREKALLYIGHVKIGRNLFEFARELTESFGLAQDGQIAAILRWTGRECFVELAKGDNLVEEQHGI